MERQKEKKKHVAVMLACTRLKPLLLQGKHRDTLKTQCPCFGEHTKKQHNTDIMFCLLVVLLQLIHSCESPTFIDIFKDNLDFYQWDIGDASV